ncbi:hypothetical protein Tco_0091359 [Tanacetum coccineum]
MSRDVAEPKLTTMDAMIDKLIGAIFIFQIVVVIVLGIAGIIWKDTKCPLRVISYLLEPELIFIFSLCSIDVELLNAINTGSLDATSFLTVMAICDTVIPIKRLVSSTEEYAAAGTIKQNYVSILLMLLRLRQACDHPLLVKGCNLDSWWKSSIDKAKKLPPEKRTGLLELLGSFFSNLHRMQLHINYGYGLLETLNGQIG